MSKSPLERAARALCALDGHPEAATMDGKPLWRDYLPEARAAIGAIREPDDKALGILAELIDPNSDTSIDDAYSALIDALLSGGE